MVIFILLPSLFSFLCPAPFHYLAWDIFISCLGYFQSLAQLFFIPLPGIFSFLAWAIFILLPSLFSFPWEWQRMTWVGEGGVSSSLFVIFMGAATGSKHKGGGAAGDMH
jgi:hypothetical protein